tara:strand:- start:308 stop:517 length:210 start_codon:yes stop_codon:yes gene_type:complete
LDSILFERISGTLFEFISNLNKQLSILLLPRHKKEKRVNTKSNNRENQEDDEVAKSCRHLIILLVNKPI